MLVRTCHTLWLLILYTEKYSPPGFFCHFSPQSQRVNFKLGEFLSLVYLPLNTTFSGGGGLRTKRNRVQVNKSEITYGKNNLVYSYNKVSSYVATYCTRCTCNSFLQIRPCYNNWFFQFYRIACQNFHARMIVLCNFFQIHFER